MNARHGTGVGMAFYPAANEHRAVVTLHLPLPMQFVAHILELVDRELPGATVASDGRRTMTIMADADPVEDDSNDR